MRIGPSSQESTRFAPSSSHHEASGRPVGRLAATTGWVALGAVVAGWVVLLAAVLTHPLFVSHDSISNNVHIWYVSSRLWAGHGLPFRMPMLAGGGAFAFPYAFIPWTTAALLRPLLGDRVVTLWLVGGFVALVTLIFWALPELRRGWPAAAVLVNPALVMALLAGQIPFIWATALLFGAIGGWRRQRTWVATLLAGLAMATHAAVVAPITVLLVAGYLPFTRCRRQLVGHFVLAALIAAPAAVILVRSPAIEQISLGFRIEQLVRTVGGRGTVVAVPILLSAMTVVGRRWIAPAAVALFGLVHLASLGPMNRYAWASPWRRPDERVMALIDSPSFVPGATYRVLGFSDGRVSMYRLVEHGARLDSELFPESQARHSWTGVADYQRFLADRRVDYLVIWTSYDQRWRTNEHELVRRLAANPTCADGPLATQLVMTDPAYEVFAVRPCRPA
jgi:hypothetical protein